MRLDRILANIGLGSRKDVRALIRRGAVQVGGQPLRQVDAQIAEADLDKLSLNGKRLDTRMDLYLILDKPADYLTAMEDTRFPCVADLLPESYLARGVFPVGRLDRDSTGLLLFTNDGQLGHRLCSPEWKQPKLYQFEHSGPAFREAEIQRVAQGLREADFVCRPAKLTNLGDRDAQLVICEGQFHQVKRMVAALGRELRSLRRLEFGPLTLAGLNGPASWRDLSDAETDAIYTSVGLEAPTLRRARGKA